MYICNNKPHHEGRHNTKFRCTKTGVYFATIQLGFEVRVTIYSGFYWDKSAIILLYTILLFPHLSSSPLYPQFHPEQMCVDKQDLTVHTYVQTRSDCTYTYIQIYPSLLCTFYSLLSTYAHWEGLVAVLAVRVANWTGLATLLAQLVSRRSLSLE